MVHLEDWAEVARIFLDACNRASTYTLQFRLRKKDRSYARVVSGAAPSISPVDGSFIGFLGALIEIGAPTSELGGERSISYLCLPPPVGSTAPHLPLEIATDHLLLARSSAEKAGDATLIAALDVALSLIFVRLGGSRVAH